MCQEAQPALERCHIIKLEYLTPTEKLKTLQVIACNLKYGKNFH